MVRFKSGLGLGALELGALELGDSWLGACGRWLWWVEACSAGTERHIKGPRMIDGISVFIR